MENPIASEENLSANLQFNDLNDYCLINIFEFVSIVERIRLTIVCKKWRNVVKNSWSKLKHLDLENVRLLGFEPRGTKHSMRKVDVFVFRKILSKCGKYLESINVDKLEKVYDDCALSDIACYCPNIQKISAENVTIKGLSKLSQKCKNLKELVLYNELVRNIQEENEKCEDVALQNDWALSVLFSNNKKLRKLELIGISITGDCLANLSTDSLETLIVEDCVDLVKFYHNVWQHLDIFIRNSKKLSKFDYDECNFMILNSLGSSCSDLVDIRLTGNYYLKNSDKLIGEIFRKSRNLKVLKLRCFDGLTGSCLQQLNKDVVEDVCLYGNNILNFNYSYIIKCFPLFTKIKALGFDIINSNDNVIANYIAMYPGLKWLSLNFSDISLEMSIGLNFLSITSSLEKLCATNNRLVTDTFLKIVRKHLKELKYLNISYCENVTDLGLEEISQLPKLIDLDIYCNKNIEGKGLRNFKNLKFLHSFSCYNLRDEGLSSLMKNSKYLEFLNIADCFNVANAFIDVAIQETKKRKNNVTLTINTTGSSVDINLICDTSPFLKILD